MPKLISLPLHLTIGCLLFLAANLSAAPVSVLTFHNDNTRQGVNSNETILTPANVNAAHFGKLFSCAVDGYVYTQPLIVPNLAIPGKGTHNVVFVATEHDSVYAFDADGDSGPDGGLLWHVNLGPAAPMSPGYGNRYHVEGNTDLVPEEGITGTPVIDPALGAIFLDVFMHEGAKYAHRIHALDITTGRERPHSPVVVAASVPGNGMDSINGVVTFKPVQHLQRAAMTLAHGILFVSYGSHGDTDPYHGWILGYDPSTLQLLPGYIFNTTPNARTPPFPHPGEGALWMGGGGLVVDAQDNLYFEVANGSFSANTNGGDYGDCFMKLSIANGKFTVLDYFAPFDEAAMQAADLDLGSGAPILLPDSVGSAEHPHLILGAGKPGIIHLLDRDHFGGYHLHDDNQIVQEVPDAILGGGSFATPAYFNGHIYYTGKTDSLKAYAIANGHIDATASSRSPTPLGPFTGSPAISANGTNDAIVWVIDPGAYLSSGPDVLHAYRADDLSQELYNSNQRPERDNPGGAVKMTCPTVANGKVYVPAEYKLSVFGNEQFLDTPAIAPNGGPFTNVVTVSLAALHSGVNLFYTLDGSAPSTNSIHYRGPFDLRENADIRAIAVKPGAIDSPVASASFVNTSASGTGTGLHFDVSEGLFGGRTLFSRDDAPLDLAAAANTTNASGATWTGCIQPRYSETYNFVGPSVGVAYLSINGKKILDSRDHSDQSRSNTIALSAQQLYNIHFEYSGPASAKLLWSSPSTPISVIPLSQLYPFPNRPPAVTLVGPVPNSTYTASASLTLSANVSAPHNAIARVDFLAHGHILATATHAPYTVTVTGLDAGDYSLTAVATDGSGLASTSAPVAVKVLPGSGQPYGLVKRENAPAFYNMPGVFTGPIPKLLSETGLFSDTAAMTPSAGLIPYSPNVPFWADGATASCFFSVPTSGDPITPAQQINFTTNGSWGFPAGSVFVKTFELNADPARSNTKRRLETQVLVRDLDGQAYGVTYKWRADNRDADLLVTSLSENISVTNAAGVASQTWYYDSPNDCRLCHSAGANFVLGINTRQINGSFAYPTGVTDNQLRAFNRLGFLNPAIDESLIANSAKLFALADSAASLENRSRSYLDANCSQCHRPGGYGGFDLRFETPLADQRIVNANAAFGLGYDHARVISPKDLHRSVLYDRVSSTNPAFKMPLLSHNVVDTNAVAVIADWINTLPITHQPETKKKETPNPYE